MSVQRQCDNCGDPIGTGSIKFNVMTRAGLKVACSMLCVQAMGGGPSPQLNISPVQLNASNGKIENFMLGLTRVGMQNTPVFLDSNFFTGVGVTVNSYKVLNQTPDHAEIFLTITYEPGRHERPATQPPISHDAPVPRKRRNPYEFLGPPPKG